MEYYSAMKNDILPFATTRMHLKGIILSELSQTEKVKYSVITLMWNIKKNKTYITKDKQTHRHREDKQVANSGENREGQDRRLRDTNYYV